MSAELLTKAGVARRINMSEKFVQRHALELGGFRLGGRLRFRESDIERWLEHHRLDSRRVKRTERSG